ncbi:hypothetical protein [Marinobacterium sediminicola]|uniref:DUF2764 family protein n=1 Tax=Marinobacterium sediminicola TaxID=518898 RepID=A0ABY1S0N5_9GAMM|nr:hypothetical protein [Marinobacterium sediminicola]ULG69586.1 hypothetical protein LN244_01870 [Marinobacterium sediminicola]SMR74686.1 hypothetical protein SAMN04487964_107150 [Marinobacterium sediminicola]
MSVYYTLIPALPALPVQLEQLKELPISILQLERRLGMLPEEDRDLLVRALRLFQRERSGDEAFSDRDEVLHWEQELASIPYKSLRAVLAENLEWRSVIAAQRYRLAGQQEGSSFEGYGKHVWMIRRDWQQPDFGLGRQYPWLVESLSQLKQGQGVELEQQILARLWRKLRMLEQSHPFSLIAVAAYRLRWSIAEYRLRWQAKAAQQNFSQLVDRALSGATQDDGMDPVRIDPVTEADR